MKETVFMAENFDLTTLDSSDTPEWIPALVEKIKQLAAESERLREQLAAVTAERDELKATIGYETQYKKAYIELSGKTGELETKINELRNKVQKTEAERDHYHRERDIWVRSNKQLQEQLASVKKERDELKAYWFDDADPSETKYANEYALAKVGAAGGVK